MRVTRARADCRVSSTAADNALVGDARPRGLPAALSARFRLFSRKIPRPATAQLRV